MLNDNKLIARVAYIIDNDGYIIDSLIIKSEKEEFKDNIVSISQPDNVSFYRRRWNGSEWVEGETQEDKNKREYNEYLASLIPSDKELDEARIEIKSITLLQEMGVV